MCMGLWCFFSTIALLTGQTHAWTPTAPSNGVRWSSSTRWSVLSSSDQDDTAVSIITQQPSRRVLISGALGTVATIVGSTTAQAAATTTTSTSSPPKVISSVATCDPAVSIWRRGNRLIYLLGTAHISQISGRLSGSMPCDRKYSAKRSARSRSDSARCRSDSARCRST